MYVEHISLLLTQHCYAMNYSCPELSLNVFLPRSVHWTLTANTYLLNGRWRQSSGRNWRVFERHLYNGQLTLAVGATDQFLEERVLRRDESTAWRHDGPPTSTRPSPLAGCRLVERPSPGTGTARRPRQPSGTRRWGGFHDDDDDDDWPATAMTRTHPVELWAAVSGDQWTTREIPDTFATTAETTK